MTQEPLVEPQTTSDSLEQLRKVETDFIIKACKMGFNADFNECKKMTLPHLSEGIAELLHTDRSDVNLQFIILI